eukprot:TRINITY_DN30128_c0_g1_i1.p1 TRINITY_DN30128_c0_g1~~TRINITY_DN30128_c0_g1_i1.p1  ORF type:complete len:119 (-),score=22.15 TRINITY_DN30128_c0_g1_i1:19-375(-)
MKPPIDSLPSAEPTEAHETKLKNFVKNIKLGHAKKLSYRLDGGCQDKTKQEISTRAGDGLATLRMDGDHSFLNHTGSGKPHQKWQRKAGRMKLRSSMSRFLQVGDGDGANSRPNLLPP